MRALVMGGTEFISLHLVQSLLARGHEVAVFNRGRRGERLPAGVEAIAGDRKDHAGLRERLGGHRFDGVFDVTYAPTLGEDVTALLDALPGRPHAIFVSTARVYDHALPIPYSEETPRGFYWGDYARHKIAGEDVLFDRHRQHGQPVSIVRPTHVMGDEITSRVAFVELIAEVMGKPVTLRYVDPALLKAAEKPGPVFGQNLVYDCHAVHTTHKLRTELGIRPRYTLASGLHHTWKWYQASGLLERPIDFTFEDQLLAKLGA